MIPKMRMNREREGSRD